MCAAYAVVAVPGQVWGGGHHCQWTLGRDAPLGPLAKGQLQAKQAKCSILEMSIGCQSAAACRRSVQARLPLSQALLPSAVSRCPEDP